MKRFFSKLVEGALMLSSTVTTLTVLLIVIYLFRESFVLFKMNSVESNFSLLIHKDNPVKKLDDQQIKKVFDQEITNWKELGGADQEIELFRIDDISNFYSTEEIGENFEHLAEKIDDHISKTPNIIAFVSDKYIIQGKSSVKLQVDNLTLPEILKGKEWFPTAHLS